MAAPTRKAHQIVRFLMAAIIGTVLLGLSGLTLAGTLVTLLLATPPLVLCSPIIVPAAIAISIATAGFIASGVSTVWGARALSSILKLNHLAVAAAEKQISRSLQLDYDILRDVESSAAKGEAQEKGAAEEKDGDGDKNEKEQVTQAS